MNEQIAPVLQLLAAGLALIGGFYGARWATLPNHFYARRRSYLVRMWVLFAAAGGLYYYAALR